jgi:hypothetical protein
MFDIVISLGLNDLELFSYQLKSLEANIIGYNNIYIITNEEIGNQLKENNCKIINENIFPFSLKTIENIYGVSSRNKWYLQQLLKLYAGFVIPGIMDRYLIIDADTFFFNPVSFIDDNKCCYNYSNQYHEPYFSHLSKLDEKLFKRNSHNYSGICHHMMFETRILKEIMTKIENKHNDEFFKVMLKLVEPYHYNGSGFSEYELYFNYIINNHLNEIKIRKLNAKNFEDIANNYEGMNEYDYVSFHSYYFDDKPALKMKVYKKIKEVINNSSSSVMTLAYSYIGPIPSYIKECMHQARLYHKDNIYLITDDLQSPYLPELISKYDITIINYKELIKEDEYIKKLEPNFNKFVTINQNNRSLLFYRSFERLFLIHSLINKLNLNDVLFLEIDNTIYENPTRWLKGFRKQPIAYMNCSYENCSSGIMYIRDKLSLCNLLDYMLYYITNNIDEFNSEMRCLFKFIYNNNFNYASQMSDCQLLPITIDKNLSSINSINLINVIENCYKNCNDYEGIFDPATYGQYLTGKDPIHTNGQLVLYEDTNDHIIKCSDYLYMWKEEDGLMKPFIYDKNGDKWILINNLHIHSKQLHLALSKPL